MSDQQPIITATAITKTFLTGDAQGSTLHVLRGISLTIMPGEIIAVVGASGAGKSTLLHILGTLDRPTSGQVAYDSTDVFALDDESLARFRNRSIGFVFQFHHLLPDFSAIE
ncbi:MAG TPA: ATP-binding cassette domain-containing protein, partial [Bacteroidota bacterium]|nr:ATP-binding cassette domain-containing protein [Bacteroidota bacterium]